MRRFRGLILRLRCEQAGTYNSVHPTRGIVCRAYRVSGLAEGPSV